MVHKQIWETPRADKERIRENEIPGSQILARLAAPKAPVARSNGPQ